MNFLNSISLFGLSWYVLLGIYTLPGLSYSGLHLYKQYRERPSDFAQELLKVIGKEKTLVDKVLNVLVYAIAVICILLGWPLFFMWAFYQSKKDAAFEIEQNKPNFNCAPEHLISKIDPHDAEIANYVIDPLGTVPPLPFGHLNKAWGNFLANLLDEEDELWSFHIPKGGKCGKYRFAASSDIQGFAKVRHGEILGEFITESD